MIDWKIFEDGILNYSSDIDDGRKIPNSAKRIALLYKQTVLTGENIFGHKVINLNTKLIETALSSIFYMGIASPQLPQDPFKMLSASFMGAWMSATYTTFPIVPPTLAPLPIPSAVITTFPGTTSPMDYQMWMAMSSFPKPYKVFAKLFTMACRIHLATVSGIYLGLIPTPSGLIPAPPIPWVGIF